MLSIPDIGAHRTKLADWLELSCIESADRRVGFGTLVSASDMDREEQPEDISEDDVWEDDLVVSVQAEITERLKCIGDEYPFSIDERGRFIEFRSNLSEAGAVYLFCLFLSHATDRSIVPEELAPPVDHAVRDLFQVCATVAAAGYIGGHAMSFGWPRPSSETFLQALNRIYALFGDGEPHAQPPPGAPKQVKDDEIDVIAWRPTPDRLPGTQYLLGQAASGSGWKNKGVVAAADGFHKFWFKHAPASQHVNAMFMPFCLEEDPADGQAVTQEDIRAGHVRYWTLKLGVLIYRCRMAHYAAEGLGVHRAGTCTVERAAEIAGVMDWVHAYSQRLQDA